MGILDRLFSSRDPRDHFAQLVIRALAEKGIANTRYDKKAFAVIIEGTAGTIFLDNTYANYAKADKRLQKILLEHLTGSFTSKSEIPHSFSAALPNLMPVVRASTYSSLIDLELTSRNPETGRSKLLSPSKPISEGIVAMLAYDTEHSIMQVNDESFGRWGVSFDDALAAAIDNLRQKTDTRLLAEEAPGAYHGQWDDSYQSARILLTDLIYRLPLHGDPVAFLPNRDELWITGTRDLKALPPLLEAADQSHFAAHPLSPNLYVLDDGQWRFYLPEEPSLRVLCLNLQRKRDAVDYSQQKDALDKIYKASKTDIFVANFIVLERKDGTRFSTCVWSKGIDSLLPKAEFLMLVTDPDNKQHLSVPWAFAFPLLSPLMEAQPNLLPVRYRVRSFPNADQIASLRAPLPPDP